MHPETKYVCCICFFDAVNYCDAIDNHDNDWGRKTIVAHILLAAYSTQHTAYSIQHTVYSIQHTAYSIQRTAYSIYHTAYSIQHTAYSIQHTAYSIQRTVYSVQHTAYKHMKLVALCPTYRV